LTIDVEALHTDARSLPLKPKNDGHIQLPTLRNIDKTLTGFVKAYGYDIA
jgi:hypothetical protein